MVCFIDNPIYKWMMTGGAPILGNDQMGTQMWNGFSMVFGHVSCGSSANFSGSLSDLKSQDDKPNNSRLTFFFHAILFHHKNVAIPREVTLKWGRNKNGALIWRDWSRTDTPSIRQFLGIRWVDHLSHKKSDLRRWGAANHPPGIMLGWIKHSVASHLGRANLCDMGVGSKGCLLPLPYVWHFWQETISWKN